MLSLEEHFGVRVFREQLRFEGFEVRQRLRSRRSRILPFDQRDLTQARAALDQDVERGVDLFVVKGETEVLERLQLADKRRDGAEAAGGEAELSQRLQLPSSAGNASSWDAFPRFLLPLSWKCFSPESSPSSSGSEERLQ